MKIGVTLRKIVSPLSTAGARDSTEGQEGYLNKLEKAES